MSELSALEKYSCPACGASAEWNPGKQALICPYCGTESSAELAVDGSGIVEHDLAKKIREIQEASGDWETGRTSVQCKSCKAITLFDPEKVATHCDFCGSPSIVAYEDTRHPIHPESLLPFTVSEPQVREQIREWYRSRWFAPNRLKTRAFTDTVHGIYIPYWTFDKRVHARWTAQSGTYYYVNKTVRGPNGKKRTVRERRTRWRNTSGSINHFFDDELVSATRGVDSKLLQKIEPFPTGELTPYDAGYVSGWVVEQYQIDLIDAASTAQARIDQQVRSLCASDVPGDTHRHLQVYPEYTDETFKHLLVPIWMLNYNFSRKTYQVIVNGFTGSIAGERPYSWIKITLLILAILIVVGTLALTYSAS